MARSLYQAVRPNFLVHGFKDTATPGNTSTNTQTPGNTSTNTKTTGNTNTQHTTHNHTCMHPNKDKNPVTNCAGNGEHFSNERHEPSTDVAPWCYNKWDGMGVSGWITMKAMGLLGLTLVWLILLYWGIDG